MIGFYAYILALLLPFSPQVSPVYDADTDYYDDTLFPAGYFEEYGEEYVYDESEYSAVTLQDLNDAGALNARRIPEGFVMMGLANMEASDSVTTLQASLFAQALYDQGIRGVVSFTRPNSALIDAFTARGIRLFADDMSEFNETQGSSADYFWNFHDFRGYSNSWHAPLLTWLADFEPNQVAIHCSHGVDRTGNAVAFILSTMYGWSIQDALYAVAYKNQDTLDGIADVLAEFGIDDRRSTDDESVSVYAYEGHAGMKADTDGFRAYIRRTIQASLEYGGDFVTGC